MSHRIHSLWPDIAADIEAATPKVAFAIGECVIRFLDEHASEVCELYKSTDGRNERQSAHQLAEDLDEKYFDLEEANPAESRRYFKLARGAAAIGFVVDSKMPDAVYEAAHATECSDHLKHLIRAVVTAEA